MVILGKGEGNPNETGLNEFEVNPFPKSPLAPCPKHCESPDVAIMHVFKTPANKLETFEDKVLTLVAKTTFVPLIAFPHCPLEVLPKHDMYPELNMAHVCKDPVAMATTLESGLLFISKTIPKVVRVVMVPSPHCPFELYPTQYRVPLEARIQVWAPEDVPPT